MKSSVFWFFPCLCASFNQKLIRRFAFFVVRKEACLKESNPVRNLSKSLSSAGSMRFDLVAPNDIRSFLFVSSSVQLCSSKKCKSSFLCKYFARHFHSDLARLTASHFQT